MSIHEISGFNKSKSDAIRIPNDLALEQGVLGAILLDNANFEIVSSRIEAEHFYEQMHGQLYRIIAARIASGQSVTATSMRQFVADWPDIDDGMPVWRYLGHLVSCAAIRMSLPTYCDDLRGMADKRQLIGIGQDLVARASAVRHDLSAMDILEAAEADLFAVAQAGTEARDMTMGEAMTGALAKINDAYERGGLLAGVSTGLIDLDAKLGGFGDTDLIILGGRPSMGKTALATNIAYHVATSPRTSQRDGPPKRGHVHFFSQEMSGEQLAMRVLAERTEIPADALRRGKITEDQFRLAASTAQTISTASLTIDETGGITLAQLAAKARREKRRKDTSLIIIDYLQLMSGAGRSSDNRVQEITQITTGLKALAKELGIPILALSQLSRKVEERSDKRPQLSDLRESGSIEQDADVVMFVYRDEYYIERDRPSESDEKFSEWQSRMQNAHGKAEIILAKARHGPVGIVEVAFQSQFTRFFNLAKEYPNAS